MARSPFCRLPTVSQQIAADCWPPAQDAGNSRMWLMSRGPADAILPEKIRILTSLRPGHSAPIFFWPALSRFFSRHLDFLDALGHGQVLDGTEVSEAKLNARPRKMIGYFSIACWKREQILTATKVVPNTPYLSPRADANPSNTRPSAYLRGPEPLRYAPQDSRTTSRGVSAKLRAGRVGSAMRSSMARKAITAMSRQG